MYLYVYIYIYILGQPGGAPDWAPGAHEHGRLCDH